MEFLTKAAIRDKLEEFLEGLPNNSRIAFTENIDNDFIHIGDSIERTIAKCQTFLINEDKENDHDKDIRQGNLSR